MNQLPNYAIIAMFILNNIQNKITILLFFSLCTLVLYGMNQCFLSNLSEAELEAYVRTLYYKAGLTNYTISFSKDNKIKSSSSSSDDSDSISSLFEETIDECNDKRMDSIIDKMFDDSFNNDDITSYKITTYEDMPTLNIQKNVTFPPPHINKVQEIVIRDPYKNFISLSSKKRTRKTEWPGHMVWQKQRSKIGTTSIEQLE